MITRAPPVTTYPTSAPPVVVRVGGLAAPAVVRTRIPGPIGPAGVAGPAGAPKGFGTIDYTDNDTVLFGGQGQVVAGTAMPLPAGQWVRIQRNLTPSGANFNLPSGPWKDFAFWDNAAGLLRARAIGDTLLYKFSFSVIPSQIGGGLRFAVRPGDDPAFDFGPEPIVLTADAGTIQAGAVSFPEQCRTRFVSQGATVYIMATTGAMLLSFSPEIYPLDYYLPPPPTSNPVPTANPGTLDFSMAGNSGLLAALGIVVGGTASAGGAPGTLDFSDPINSNLLAAIGA